MFKDAFLKLDKEQAQKTAKLVEPYLDIEMEKNVPTVMMHDLSFYPDHYLVELSRHDIHPPLVRQAVFNNQGIVKVLNWTNDVIYDLNKTAPIKLDNNTVLDYIRFFFTYVRGKHGRFLIVESVDDMDWREEPSISGRKALSKLIFPMTLKEQHENESWVFSACFIYKDSLFTSSISIKINGDIKIFDEEIVVEDIPVADDVFNQ